MSYQQEVFSLIAQFSGQANTIAVPRVLCKFAGSLESGTLLSQMLYWSDRGGDSEGWFYKSYADWEEETFLTEYQVRKITKKFEDLGFLETKLKKANGAPTLHYRINPAKFSESILEFFSIDSLKFKNGNLKIKESITKTTTKTTTKNIQAASASPLPTPFQAMQTAWETTKQKHEPGAIINWGKEGVAIKALLAKGWTPEQVVACAEVMYADAFYQGKSLSLQSVATQIAAKDVKARGGSSSQRIKSKAEWCLDKYTVSDPKMRPDLSPTRVQEEYEAYAASH